ncbi:MAG TPA: P1 family peptidase [Dermatophilaceae bacterium]|jgi:putative pantetheine hydrolase|uniref:P1 family peptidase n=1 Tax=Candidatus Phosphoribacter hodrii TaxID=2953743 RepID=A0A934X4B0_9MICO|nr:P1 family peptidase [Candidatus Phosphoribacter hodrii]HNV14827.1 P1 family peptidase [Dermatophilaceae bacterium]HOF38216.1 P1 family peptidase [Dermatophilaceae bacterium]HOV00123.1 P1 family peptidase [Dermatophilaceae bacterium]HQH91826.1 P1 family peptidase [Dermatophilaceae bacterium]
MTENPAIRPGRTNSLTDVDGIRVGHATRIGDGWLTGTTVVLAPDGGAVGGVDVRGGGPGTRETDLLDPRNMVDRVHAVVLSGGSAFGLAAADGVMVRLASAGVGFPVGGPGEVVPIVPAAVIFDLGRGGSFGKRPDAAMGNDALVVANDGPVQQGCVGAGTGARAGGLKGGVGSASAVLPDGTTVAALIVVNAVGSCVDPLTGELYAARFGLPGEFPSLGSVSEADLAAARERAAAAGPGLGLGPGLATTIGVIATDATLTKAQCAKVSGIGHDGMARAIRPVHTMFDGDTLFTLASGARGAAGAPDPLAFHALLDAAGDCVTRAIGHAMLSATTVTPPAGEIRCLRDAFPSAFAH